MNRIEIINYLIKKNNYKRYLEIGVQNGHCFKQIEAPFKVGVDPDQFSKATHHVTSDEFFRDSVLMFDVVFVDGLHIHPQPLLDIKNALKYLSPNGVIIVHDCNPEQYEHQVTPRISKYWTGDVWRSWIELESR